MPAIRPADGMKITADATFEPGTYFLPSGITIEADNVTLDGNGALLVGHDRERTGVRIDGRSGVTVRGLRLREFRHGIVARNAKNATLCGNHVTSTAEVPANTIFLDIWLPAEKAYGAGILLERVEDSRVADNDLQHQMNGLLTYQCSRLTVQANNANYSSGYGIHLFETSDSVFERNFADYCCRWEPRDKDPASVAASRAIGHMGADATGFLIVHKSCRNVFRSNYARLGGDGFFLAGRSPSGADVGCDNNLFEGNDGSLSPNIAFEATFSRNNVFRSNKADRCNFGFWLGFSRDFVLEDNQMVMNRQAGIAVENGGGFAVRGCQFQRNGAGVLLWSKYVKEWHDALPANRTVHHWTIEDSVFTRNDRGIAILADKDHGVRPLPEEISGKPELRPHDNAILGNDIQDNRVGIELFRTDRTVIERNMLNRNVEANVRQDDAKDTTLRNNLGYAGAYL